MRRLNLAKRRSKRVPLLPRVAQLTHERLDLLLRALRRSLRGGAPVLRRDDRGVYVEVVVPRSSRGPVSAAERWVTRRRVWVC